MLASLTGLLLTLGGDQPAVVFDPPLDPAVFDWDGQTLSVKPESLPLDLSFAGPPSPPFTQFQRVVVNETVEVRGPRVFFFDESIQTSVLNALIGWWQVPGDGEFWDGESLAAESSTLYAGQTIFVYAIRANSPIPVIEFLPRQPSAPGELELRIKALEQALESCQCASDLDGDGAVGFTDLVQLISDWGPCSA